VRALVVEDVVDAGLAALDRDRGRRGGVVDVEVRERAAAITDPKPG
jgi:hypothetical protein